MKPGEAGGKETLRRHGRQHFREIGKKGIEALANKYFGGSIGDAMTWLRSRRNELHIAALVDEKLDRQIAAGASVAVEELPVLVEPDCDPSYWRELVKRRDADLELPF